MTNGYTLLEMIKIRLRQFSVGDDGSPKFTSVEDNLFLEQLIDEATDEVKTARNYPSTFSEDDIESDLTKFQRVIISLVLYDYNKEGTEGQDSDSENGYKRDFTDRDKLLASVTPFVKALV